MRRLLLSLFVCCSLATAASFTLEQVLSAPFPSDLVAAPGGAHLAWVLNDQGKRNVWVASAPDYKGVRVTSYMEDDGQDLGQLQWTPDGRAVVYTHGGDLEFLGRPDPNPTANPAGVEQDICVVIPGQAPRKLGVGYSPAVSPNSDRVAFLHAGQIWAAPLSGSAPAEMLIHARPDVSATDLQWSPDGSKLAFVSDRTTHSFIVVYDFAAKSVVYLEPTVDRDSGLVARWQADRVHPQLRGWIHAGTHQSAAMGDSRGERRHGIRTGNLARHCRPRQRLPRGGFRSSTLLGRGRPHPVSVGERRLVPSVRRRGRRRAGQALDPRQFRSRACRRV